jgi:hypothetical protein
MVRQGLHRKASAHKDVLAGMRFQDHGITAAGTAMRAMRPALPRAMASTVLFPALQCSGQGHASPGAAMRPLRDHIQARVLLHPVLQQPLLIRSPFGTEKEARSGSKALPALRDVIRPGPGKQSLLFPELCQERSSEGPAGNERQELPAMRNLLHAGEATRSAILLPSVRIEGMGIPQPLQMRLKSYAR